MLFKLSKIAATCLFVLIPVISSAQQKNPCALPTGLPEEIAKKYQGARVITISDLSEYERKLYLKDHGRRCPGLAKVDFYGEGIPTWALILIKTEAGKSKTELLVVQKKESGWKIDSLLSADSSRPVVWREGPGKYEEIYGQKEIVAPHPIIIWCDYGSSAIAFAWINNKVEKVWLSD